jgi:predicted neuraminidase
MSRISTDNGMTWSEDRVFEDRLGWLPRNVPITLRSGELLLPLSGRVGESYGSFLLKTSDNGTTWEPSGVIQGGSQPTVVERSDGSLFVMMRRRRRITQSESTDGGRTWSDAKQSELKNPDAGIAMTRLRNGHLVLVFNDSAMARTPLSIVRSIDEGKTWETPMKLEANPGEYSYPSVIQTSDGKIHVTYTYRRYAIKHVELDEGWLTHLDRPN